MRAKILLLFMASSLACPGSAQTPRPEDIVKAEPVSLAPAQDGQPDITRFLLVRSPRDAVLSSDGTELAWISDVTGSPQIWTMPVAGGFPNQLTYASGVDWLVAGPAGQWLYGADTDGDERVGMHLLSADGTSERTIVEKSPAFRSFGAWSSDRRSFAYSSTERNGTDFDIYVTDVETGQSRRVYEGTGGFYASAWQPGGNLIAVSERRGGGNNLHLLDAVSGTLTTIFKPETISDYNSIEWAPDGSGFYLSTNQSSDHHEIAFYDVSKRRLETIIKPGFDIDQVALCPDGRYLVWTTIETGFSHLHARDLTTGRDIGVPSLPSGTMSIEFAGERQVLLISANSPTTAGQVLAWDLSAQDLAPRVLVPTDAPGLDLSQMVVPEPVRFAARDGAPLTGLLYLPQAAPDGRKPPVFMRIHGGPSSFARPSFLADVQYYVARGIAVLDFNYRGSTGQGKAFEQLNDREKKVDEVGDLADAAAWLRASGRVDGSRIAVGGGSYGGYLTNQALGTYPEMFVAGVSIVGVSDWVTALEQASPGLKAADKLEFGDIADPKVRAFFAKLSPINNVARITKPVLVMHGANDPRDPVTESDRLVEGIRANGGEVTYLRFPDEGHGITRLANRVHGYRRIAAFLEEHFGLSPSPGSVD
jgi:dipeptidyl aminopeptidase/acylaminoacyl peptidase